MTMSEALPMFPLGSVLLPGGVLPLHVFEPRYRTLIHDCLDAPRHEFGVVLIARGSEVGGGDERTVVGTRARLVEVAELPDGRYAAVAVGVERLRVVQWLPDDPYPQAMVESWPDDDDPDAPGDLAVAVAATTARVRRCVALAVELGDPVGDATTPVADDPALAAFQLAMLAPIGPLDRLQILAAAHVRERLDVLNRVLDDVEALLRFRLGTASG